MTKLTECCSIYHVQYGFEFDKFTLFVDYLFVQVPQTLREFARKIRGMWSNNTGGAKIEGGSNRSF